MKIVNRQVSELIHAEYNPRQLTEDQHQQLKDSLTRFGFVDPIIVNKHSERLDIIVGGHQRCKVWAGMGNSEVPTVEVDLTPDREKELNIRLNKNSGEWDYDMLANYFDTEELMEWGFKEQELGFFSQPEAELPYSKKIEVPIYKPKNKKPAISELYNIEKTDTLIKEIKKSSIDKNIKQFLIIAAQRHIIFSYDNIADFYSHSNKEIQDLMEKSALVIIDFNKAIENGFTQISEEITSQYFEDGYK